MESKRGNDDEYEGNDDEYEENDDDILETESDIAIFDEFRSLIDLAEGRFDKFMLTYHYRSKYKELIDFSNYKYYQGKLNIVSDTLDKKLPIEVINVDGIRINKINEIEANAVVDLTSKIINNENYEGKSIGIITFNSDQQSTIETKIQEFASSNPKMAEHVNNEDPKKRLFIKNIENVQGDERDIIIFSIGFAKDEFGGFRNNFGPLNNEGGEKRLNVAVSRAKEKMFVVKSINSGEIRANKKGAQDFKDFLKYCELLQEKNNQESIRMLLSNEANNLVEEVNFDQQFDSPFEEEVYDELIAILPRRYIVRTQVEASKFKIDLVIFDTV
ncbi:hypothetical protein Zmor_003990 [Zophobas morio]|uniref:DNA2/NAM7 helicase-like C-terminal domain-containing protein n=1 Tax=Zophobas morio TaxID=2755281 RepID=A0AA38HKT8_9CUCU|nr:hypothetical protein Zmor_003990 [Zophobas morio]